MNKFRDRAQAQFPSVLLTLISIIQALALELLWSKGVESSFIWSFNYEALIAWGMLSASFLALLLIWAMYSTMVMGFIWNPLLRDSILPFVIGIQEFMMINLIDERFTPSWFLVIALIFISANWVSHSSLRRARQYEENSEFFADVNPAELKDFIPLFLLVGLFMAMGLLTSYVKDSQWIVLSAVIISNIILFAQLIGLRQLWRRIMGMEKGLGLKRLEE